MTPKELQDFCLSIVLITVDDARPSVCPSVCPSDLVFKKIGGSQSRHIMWPAECGTRQAIQARPDHPNRVVSPPRGLPFNMQQVTPAPNRPICHEVQQQISSVCVTSTISPGLGSGRTQPAMLGSGCICLPTSSYFGHSGGEAAALPRQENHSDYTRVIQHALVLGPSDHIKPNPSVTAQSAESANTAL